MKVHEYKTSSSKLLSDRLATISWVERVESPEESDCVAVPLQPSLFERFVDCRFKPKVVAPFWIKCDLTGRSHLYLSPVG